MAAVLIWPVLVRVAPDVAGLFVLLWLAALFVVWVLGAFVLDWALKRLNR